MNDSTHGRRTPSFCMRASALLAMCGGLSIGGYVVAADEPAVGFAAQDDRVEISIGQQRVATFVFRDAKILRPYFAAVATSSGRQVTRNHPPQEGEDPTDHAMMHPGVWVAFGDLGGHDFWRNKGRVVQRRFVEEPTADGARGSFVAENEYLTQDGRTLCREQSRWTVVAQSSGWWLLYDGSFTATVDALAFGDQEEMGLGVRMATLLSVAKGGEIRDSAGRKNEKAVWGQQAAWCDYGGAIDGGAKDGRRIGVAIVPHGENFRKSWFHVRDYGLMVANPFGRNALARGEKSRVEIPRDKPLRLRYAVFVYDTGGEGPDIAAAYREADQR